MNFNSPLRYPGGKGKITKFVHDLFKVNGLCDGIYVEPYAGGASVALSLLFNEYAKRIIINDKDLSLYAFWHSVLNETESLCKKIFDCKIDVDNWDIQRSIQKDKPQQDLLTLGFSTFFLNRCNRSGIIMAGIIGGRKQDGNYKIDARFNKKDLVKRIERIANYRERIELYNLDALQLIENVSKEKKDNLLYYLDPPYFVKGQVLYMNHYQAQDHVNIYNLINSLDDAKWIVSYDNIQFIRDLYSKYSQVYYKLNYSASKRSKGEEVIIHSNNILLPLGTLEKLQISA
jgi:DNA adenine methylase